MRLGLGLDLDRFGQLTHGDETIYKHTQERDDCRVVQAESGVVAQLMIQFSSMKQNISVRFFISFIRLACTG